MQRIVLSSIALFIVPGLTFGQFPSEKSVTQPQALVRSGPGEAFMATSKLKAGDKVIVLRVSEIADWYAIKPPADSFSWVKLNSLTLIDATKYGVVDTGEKKPANVFAGSRLVDRKPDVVTTQLKKGTIVVVVEKPLTFDGETWCPIVPDAAEVRYVHKSAFDNAVEPPPRTDIQLQVEVLQLRERIENLEERIKLLEKRKKKK